MRRPPTILIVIALVAVVPLLGVAVDHYTALDPRGFLLYFTALGALATAGIAQQQVRMTRQALELTGEAERWKVNPFLTVDGSGTAADGTWTTVVHNHGAGVAADIKAKWFLMPPDTPIETDQMESAAIESGDSNVLFALGPGASNTFPILHPKEIVNREHLPPVVAVFIRFDCGTAYGGRVQNEGGGFARQTP